MHLAPGDLCSLVCGLPNIYLHILENSFATRCPRNISYRDRDNHDSGFYADAVCLLSRIYFSSLFHILLMILILNPHSALSPIPQEAYHHINLSFSEMSIIERLIVFWLLQLCSFRFMIIFKAIEANTSFIFSKFSSAIEDTE